MHVYKFSSQPFCLFLFMISIQGKEYKSDVRTVVSVQTFRFLRMQIACALLFFFSNMKRNTDPKRGINSDSTCKAAIILLILSSSFSLLLQITVEVLLPLYVPPPTGMNL